ncbi:MAG: beta-propeller domain-containing protein [Planctomycetota bacterium]|nr:beta-propeller domain-containing protein [Planctomycetota bacterium]
MCRQGRMVWIGAVLLALLAGCGNLGWIDLTFQPNADRKDSGEANLRRINSAEGWIEFFRDQINARREQPYGRDGDFLILEADLFVGGAPAPMGQAAPAADGGASLDDSGVGGPGFSNTNVQEIGVDEADVVKTDGQYIYMLVGSELRIIQAYPASELQELAAVPLDGSSWSNSQLYLNADRVIAITQPQQVYLDDPMILLGDGAVDDGREDEPRAIQSPVELIEEYGLYYEHQKTNVAVIDVSDAATPVIEAQWTLDGYYVDSRMIDGVLHVVLNQSPYIPFELEPATITSENIEKFIPGYGVSFADGSEDSGMLVAWGDFYRPADPDGYNITSVVSIDTTNPGAEFGSVAIMADPGTVYASTTALYLTDPDYDYFGEWREMLDIHKVALTKGGAAYSASGSVQGRLVNQFALGEYQDHLRVATTTGWPWAWDAQTSTNNVFVLATDGDTLKTVGSITGLAPGEQIYSARFLGERGFMVTFRQIDPLFALDLSNPADPRVAGELKITGFSEYIHPLDEDHLLTLGRAGTDEGFIEGLQLSIFDVSDLSNPQLVTTKQIGGPGTYSEAEYNHKAITFYPQENLLALPVQIYGDFWEYETSAVQVYHVTPQDGITLRGQISTEPNAAAEYPSYWGWSRGLFIDNTVYAVTEISVQAASLDNPGDVTQSIEIEGSTSMFDGGFDDIIVLPAGEDDAGSSEGGSAGETDASEGIEI